jgi:hypothetical protein
MEVYVLDVLSNKPNVSLFQVPGKTRIPLTGRASEHYICNIVGGAFLLNGAASAKKFKVGFKGTMPRDFRLQVFFMNQFPPKPLSIPIGQIEKIFKLKSINVVFNFFSGGGEY